MFTAGTRLVRANMFRAEIYPRSAHSAQRYDTYLMFLVLLDIITASTYNLGSSSWSAWDNDGCRSAICWTLGDSDHDQGFFNGIYPA